MLIKLTQTLQKTNPLKRTYKGTVIDNEDPEKLGRVKATVDGIFEGSADDLPWIAPRRSNMLGGKSDSGFYSVPEVGSSLEIKFPFEDIYSPFYYGYWEDANTHQADFDADYPKSYGFTDSNGTKLIINKEQKTLAFTHTSGITINMDEDGNLSFNVPKDFTGAVQGNANMTITKDLMTTVQGLVSIISTKAMTLDSTDKVDIKSAKDMKLDSTMKFDAESVMDMTLKSGTKTTIEANTLIEMKALILKLGVLPTFHTAIAENLVAYNDSHQHPPIPPLAGGPVLPPVVKMGDLAGSVLDPVALKIFIQGNI